MQSETEDEQGEIEYENVDVQEYTVEKLLISLVQARPPLWDSRLPLKDRSKTIRDQLWLQIFEEFGNNPQFSIEMLMRKWRSLRDSYVRIKGEYIPSGSSATKKKKWEYFDLMSFLNDTIEYKATVSNVKITSPIPSTSTTPSPLTSPGWEEGNQASGKKKEIPKAETAISDALTKINLTSPPPLALQKDINPICLRISEMLDAVPQKSRTLLEIKLLQMAYERVKDFL